MTNTVYFHNTNREEEDSDSVSTTTEESPATSRRHTTTGEILSSGSVAHTPLREGGKLEISLSKSFSFKELRSATRNFHHKNLLGEGAFGMVFKGWIDENKLVATKPGKGIPVAIKRRSQDSIQGHGGWQQKIVIKILMNVTRYTTSRCEAFKSPNKLSSFVPFSLCYRSGRIYAKSHIKAMRIAVSIAGVASVKLQGDDKDQIVVTGKGIDLICLIVLIRKKVGYTELVSVTSIKEKDKKKEDKKETKTEEVLPMICQYGPPQCTHTPGLFRNGLG